MSSHDEDDSWGWKKEQKARRDMFAAAALTGIIASKSGLMDEARCREAWRLAGYMLKTENGE